ncbi:MAG: DUF3341 domain-containing protein [bacterium]|nr:DUF3341 domain-containing protein [bacterium]
MSERGTATSAGGAELYGFLVEFEDVDTFIEAAEEVRDAGYTKWDTHTPFVVHGLDGAMGIRATKLPLIVFAGGLAGTTLGIALQWWTNAVDYPFLISGKPLFSLPANIPVAFETTILLAALCALGGMLWLNGLPRLYHPLFKSEAFKRATDDRFFISVESADPLFDEVATRSLLESLHGARVEEIEE